MIDLQFVGGNYYLSAQNFRKYPKRFFFNFGHKNRSHNTDRHKKIPN